MSISMLLKVFKEDFAIHNFIGIVSRLSPAPRDNQLWPSVFLAEPIGAGDLHYEECLWVAQ